MEENNNETGIIKNITDGNHLANIPFHKAQNIIIKGEINELIKKNKNKWEIYTDLLTRYDISKTRYNKLYQLVIGILKKCYGIDKEELRNNILSRNKYLYELALEKGDIKLALDINKEEAKVMGIYMDNVIMTQNNQVGVKFVAVFGDEE